MASFDVWLYGEWWDVVKWKYGMSALWWPWCMIEVGCDFSSGEAVGSGWGEAGVWCRGVVMPGCSCGFYPALSPVSFATLYALPLSPPSAKFLLSHPPPPPPSFCLSIS